MFQRRGRRVGLVHRDLEVEGVFHLRQAAVHLDRVADRPAVLDLRPEEFLRVELTPWLLPGRTQVPV